MSRVSEKIKNVREKKGLTQKQLAKKLGVAESFIKEVEFGKKIINQNIIDRISKVLGEDINDITMSFEEQTFREKEEIKTRSISKKEKVNDMWSSALSSVIKSIPICDYSLKRSYGTKKLPVIESKIEGYNPEKVIYLKIDDEDMTGFRMNRGDLAFCFLNSEVDNNSLCLVEYKGKKAIRQIKKIDNTNALLISSRGQIITESIKLKDFKVLAKLIKLEINL